MLILIWAIVVYLSIKVAVKSLARQEDDPHLLDKE